MSKTAVKWLKVVAITLILIALSATVYRVFGQNTTKIYYNYDDENKAYQQVVREEFGQGRYIERGSVFYPDSIYFYQLREDVENLAEKIEVIETDIELASKQLIDRKKELKEQTGEDVDEDLRKYFKDVLDGFWLLSIGDKIEEIEIKNAKFKHPDKGNYEVEHRNKKTFILIDYLPDEKMKFKLDENGVWRGELNDSTDFYLSK